MSTSSEGSKNSLLIKSSLLELLGEWKQTLGTKISGTAARLDIIYIPQLLLIW